jgi:hypothetical protein
MKFMTTQNSNLPRDHRSWRFALALIGLVSFAGVVILLYHTRFGPMLVTDSASYIQGAINLRAGRGYSRFTGEEIAVPITGFPPVFSLALAGFSLAGLDIQEVARIFNAVLFGLSVFLGGYFIFRYTGSAFAALLGCFLMLATKSLIVSHSYLLSEALFTFLSLLSILAILRYFRTGGRPVLIISGILVALAILTRYAGLSLAAALPIAIALFGKGSWKSRLADISLLGAAILLPVGLWGYRNYALAGTTANRAPGYYPISYDIIVAYIDEWMALFVPTGLGIRWRLRVLLIFAGLVWVAAIFVWREMKSGFLQDRLPKNGWTVLPWVLLIYIPIYQVSVLTNTMFFDASAGVGAARRFLAPVLIPAIILVIGMLYRLVWVGPGRPLWKASSLIYALLVLGLSAQVTAGFVRDPRFGAERAEARRLWTEMVKGLQELDPSRPLISNDPQQLYLISQRSAYIAPIRYSRYTRQVNDEFARDVREMKRRMDQEGAILVLFRDPLISDDEEERKADERYVKELTQGLVKLAVYSRATFYVSPDAQENPAP